MSPVLVPKAERESLKRPAPVSVRIPAPLLKEIESAAGALKLTRHDAILQLLSFAIAEHKKDAKKAKK